MKSPSEGIPPEKIEKEPTSFIDEKIADIEAEPDLFIRAQKSRDFFEEFFRDKEYDPVWEKAIKEKAIEVVDTEAGGGAQAFSLLTGKEILGTGNGPHYYTKTSEHILRNVPQGNLWRAPRIQSPYLRTSMSTCSTLVGITKDDLFVAHVEYSKAKETEVVMKIFKDAGVVPENIFGVASLDSSSNNPSYLAAAEEYHALGIPEENLFSFEFKREEKANPYFRDGAKDKNITQVLVTRDFIFQYSFDIVTVGVSMGIGELSEIRSGEYKNEKVVDLRGRSINVNI